MFLEHLPNVPGTLTKCSWNASLALERLLRQAAGETYRIAALSAGE